jgi:16S rRNA (guanine966-N2)-methyltransferase
MRVIGGRLGGRRLQAPRGRGTRPTSDRVREALFSMLGDVGEMRVLDLFAGSGALGIEALSRGAAAAVFVERDPAALAALRANLTALGLEDDVAEVRRGEALRALHAAREEGEKYDLVFVDPPYREAHRWGPQLSPLLPALLVPGAFVVAESDRRAPLELALAPWRSRRYGDTAISIQRQQ